MVVKGRFNAEQRHLISALFLETIVIRHFTSTLMAALAILI